MATTPPLPPQDLPEWMTYSLVTDPGGQLTYTLLHFPLTYYGPSIPLGDDGVWTYGGLYPPESTTVEAPPTEPTEPPPPATTVVNPTTVTQVVTVSTGPPGTTFTLTPPASVIDTPPTSTPASITSSAPSSPTSTSPDDSTAASVTASVATSVIFPTVQPDPSASPTSEHKYLGLGPDSFLGLVIGLALAFLIILYGCFLGIALCLRRRRRQRRRRSSHAERQALLSEKRQRRLLPPIAISLTKEGHTFSEKAPFAGSAAVLVGPGGAYYEEEPFSAFLTNEKTARLAGDRSPRASRRNRHDGSFTYPSAGASDIFRRGPVNPSAERIDLAGRPPIYVDPVTGNEVRRSHVAALRAAGYDHDEDALDITPTSLHPSLPLVGEQQSARRQRTASYNPARYAFEDPDFGDEAHHSRDPFADPLDQPPPVPTVILPRAPPSTWDGNLSRDRLDSLSSSELGGLAAAAGAGLAVHGSSTPIGIASARKSTDELDKDFDTTPQRAEFESDSDQVERRRRQAVADSMSEDIHLRRWLETEGEIPVDLMDDPPPPSGVFATLANLGKRISEQVAASMSSPSGSGLALFGQNPSSDERPQRRTRNLEEIHGTAIGYPESPISDVGEKTRLVVPVIEASPLPSTQHSPSLSPLTRHNSRILQEGDAPAFGTPPRPRKRGAPSGLQVGAWVRERQEETEQLEKEQTQQQRKTPLFQRLFQRVTGRKNGETVYAAIPPEQKLEEGAGPNGERASSDMAAQGLKTYSRSAASTSKDDFRRWGRLANTPGDGVRSSFGANSALRQSSESTGRSTSRLGMTGDDEGERPIGGLGLHTGPPAVEEDITEGRRVPIHFIGGRSPPSTPSKGSPRGHPPLLTRSPLNSRPTTPHTPPPAPTREHRPVDADFGKVRGVPPFLALMPEAQRHSVASQNTSGSQNTAWFDAKSILGSSSAQNVPFAARGPSPLAQGSWSSQNQSLGPTPVPSPQISSIAPTLGLTMQDRGMLVASPASEPLGPDLEELPPSSNLYTPQQSEARLYSSLPAFQSSPSPAHSRYPSANTLVNEASLDDHDVLDFPPPLPIRDARHVPSLSTVFSVGSLEQETNSPSVRRASLFNPREARASMSGEDHQDPSSNTGLPLISAFGHSRTGTGYSPTDHQKRLSDISHVTSSEGSGYGELLSTSHLGDRARYYPLSVPTPPSRLSQPQPQDLQETDLDLDEEPPMAAGQWRVLSTYKKVPNMSGNETGMESAPGTGVGVGPRQRTVSAREAEERTSWRWSLGQLKSTGRKDSTQDVAPSIRSQQASTHSGSNNSNSNGSNSQRSKDSSNRSQSLDVSEQGTRSRPRSLSNPIGLVAQSLGAIREGRSTDNGPSNNGGKNLLTFWRKSTHEEDELPPTVPLHLRPGAPRSPQHRSRFARASEDTVATSSHGHTMTYSSTLAGSAWEGEEDDEDDIGRQKVPLSDVEEILEPSIRNSVATDKMDSAASDERPAWLTSTRWMNY